MLKTNMAPKKSVEKTSSPAKNKQAKVPKIRVKKEKPKLKIPSIVKVKLPSIKSLLAESQHEAEMTPAKPLTAAQKKMQLANERKVELANEVALAQLVKSPVPKTPEVSLTPKAKQVKATTPKATKVPVRKKGRPKKVKDLENSTTEEVAVPPKRKVSKKSTIKSVKTEVEDVNKIDAPGPRKPVLKRNKEPETPSKYSASIKQTRSNSRKGKKVSEDVPKNDDPNSPSVLDLEAKSHLNSKENGNPVSSKENASNEKSEPVNSRKTSTNSECPSWTKDISSSSTTTCVTVCSTDFVRIDNKIPMVKLSNIDNELKKTVTVNNKDNLSLSDSETNEKTTKCTSESSWSSDEDSASGPNLSSPSNSVKSHNSSGNNLNASLSSEKRNNIIKMGDALDKLSSKLKQLDLEIINWSGYGNEDLPKPTIEFQDKIFKILKEESQILADCRKLKAIFAKDTEVFKNNEDCPNIDSNNDHTKQPNDYMANLTDISEDDNQFTSSASKYAMLNQRSDNVSLKEKPSTETSEEDFTSNKVENTAFDQSNDDDDALSLFADDDALSLSRYSSAASMCVGTDFEEYVPQSISKDQFTESVSYHPTKITDNEIVVTNKTKIICKKQFADSTHMESELNEEPSENASTTLNEHSYDTTTPDQTAACNPPVYTLTSKNYAPCLISSLHKATSAVKSIVFRGVCFFNLISNCKKARCTFPHIQLEINEVKNRLVRLNEGVFIQEYMLMRNWPGLRRQYGMCFVEECLNRDLTRILVEVAIDFIQKANVNSFEDGILKVDVNEHVLMHLNKIDLNMCADLLQHNVEQNKTLCDVFMQTIAETQNFSRFKLVFINLTHFIVQNGGSFSLDVANQILERVCILPCEMPLAKALMTIMENTEQTIFNNAMTKQFEKHLSSLDSDLYEKYMSLKGQAFVNLPGLDNINQEQDKTSVAHSDGDRYTSPDTTKLDNLNKTIEEPIVTRNLDMLRNLPFNNMHQNSNREEEYRPAPKKQKFNQYGSITHKFMNRFQLRPPRPPMRPHGPMMRPPINKRRSDQRHVVYGQFPNFPRRPGPAPDF